MEPQKKTTLTEGSVAKGMLLFALLTFKRREALFW